MLLVNIFGNLNINLGMNDKRGNVNL
jgi:hypothetical protein